MVPFIRNYRTDKTDLWWEKKMRTEMPWEVGCRLERT